MGANTQVICLFMHTHKHKHKSVCVALFQSEEASWTASDLAEHSLIINTEIMKMSPI